jgi:hypothetical protein
LSAEGTEHAIDSVDAQDQLGFAQHGSLTDFRHMPASEQQKWRDAVKSE